VANADSGSSASGQMGSSSATSASGQMASSSATSSGSGAPDAAPACGLQRVEDRLWYFNFEKLPDVEGELVAAEAKSCGGFLNTKLTGGPTRIAKTSGVVRAITFWVYGKPQTSWKIFQKIKLSDVANGCAPQKWNFVSINFDTVGSGGSEDCRATILVNLLAPDAGGSLLLGTMCPDAPNWSGTDADAGNSTDDSIDEYAGWSKSLVEDELSMIVEQTARRK
jgi:hypothetical protein